MALTLLKSKRPELVKHVAKDLDLRLALIDAPKGVDKFYHILGIANEGR